MAIRLQQSILTFSGLYRIEYYRAEWEPNVMVTDIAEKALREEQMQMLHVLIKRMLMETNPEKLKMYTEQIGRIASASEKRPKAA